MESAHRPSPPATPADRNPMPLWPLAGAHDVRDAVWAAYADPARGYHDTRHLAEVVARIAELRGAGAVCDAEAVLLAAWFHDAIYDGERDAEERSAAWAEDALAAHVSAATTAEVVRLVRLTELHRPESDDANGAVLSDADLGVLASTPTRYAEYAATVRAEYAHLDEATFRRGRHAVLSDLLSKPHLFHTRHGIDRWEAPARANAVAELDRLVRPVR